MYPVALSCNLSGISKMEGGLDLLLSGPLADIKLPDEPLRSLTLRGSHIRKMIAEDALYKAILSVQDLTLKSYTTAYLVLCHQKITGIPPVDDQPFTFQHLRR